MKTVEMVNVNVNMVKIEEVVADVKKNVGKDKLAEEIKKEMGYTDVFANMGKIEEVNAKRSWTVEEFVMVSVQDVKKHVELLCACLVPKDEN